MLLNTICNLKSGGNYIVAGPVCGHGERVSPTNGQVALLHSIMHCAVYCLDDKKVKKMTLYFRLLALTAFTSVKMIEKANQIKPVSLQE